MFISFGKNQTSLWLSNHLWFIQCKTYNWEKETKEEHVHIERCINCASTLRSFVGDFVKEILTTRLCENQNKNEISIFRLHTFSLQYSTNKQYKRCSYKMVFSVDAIEPSGKYETQSIRLRYMSLPECYGTISLSLIIIKCVQMRFCYISR